MMLSREKMLMDFIMRFGQTMLTIPLLFFFGTLFFLCPVCFLLPLNCSSLSIDQFIVFQLFWVQNCKQVPEVCALPLSNMNKSSLPLFFLKCNVGFFMIGLVEWSSSSELL